MASMVCGISRLAIGQYMPPPLEVFANVLVIVSSHYLRGLGLPEGGYLPHILYTTRTVLFGVFIGFALGLVSGFASWRWWFVDEASTRSSASSAPVVRSSLRRRSS